MFEVMNIDSGSDFEVCLERSFGFEVVLIRLIGEMSFALRPVLSGCRYNKPIVL